MSEVRLPPQQEGAKDGSTTDGAATSSSPWRSWLKQDVRMAGDYKEQTALLDPFRWFGMGGGKKADADKTGATPKGDDRKEGAAAKHDAARIGATAKDDATKVEAAVAKTDATKHEAAATKDIKANEATATKDIKANEATATKDTKDVSQATVPLPAMPNDFGSESVLRTWIGEFNKSLVRRDAKMLRKLKEKGWADDTGLSYELLAAAAANEPLGQSEQAPAPQDGPVPAPVSNARILQMMAKGNGLLFNVITPDYQGKCMQFTQQMLKEMGARRADKSSTGGEKRKGTPGPLTAKYRGQPVAALGSDVVAGYQICVTSMPEWGFTEVGNHWFISAGNGHYLDNSMGVTDGIRMTASLVKTTGDQWAARVLDKDVKDVRETMQKEFAHANPEFKKYVKTGRTATEQQKKIGRNENPDYKDEGALEAEGRRKIKEFVTNRKDYHPRIWLVEPTTKADTDGP